MRILGIKNAKFSGYCFYVNPNIKWNFQICISVPLIYLNFCSDFFGNAGKQFDEKAKFNLKIYDVNKLGNKWLQYTYCPVSHEVKTIRKRNLVG